MFEKEVIQKPEQIVVSLSTTIEVEEIKNLIGPTFMKLLDYIQKKKATIVAMPFVAYKNLDELGNVDEKNVEIEIGFPIDKLISSKDDMVVYNLEPYKAIKCLYTGVYDGLSEVYQEIMEEIKTQGGKSLGISYEYYLTDDSVDLDKQETLIEIPFEPLV